MQASDKLIAHFLPLKAWRGSLFIMLLVLLAPWMTFMSFGGHLLQRLEGRPFLIPLFVGMWFCAVGSFAIALTIIKLMLFDAGKAVWINRGTLIYISRLFFSVRCDEISSLSKGITGRFGGDAIIIRLRNGGQKDLPTGSLSEPRDTVIDRLNEALGLK